MTDKDFIVFFESRNTEPVDKWDVIIAKLAILSIKIGLFLVLGFMVLMFMFFFRRYQNGEIILLDKEVHS